MTISRQDPGATQAHLASRLALTLEMMIVTNKNKNDTAKIYCWKLLKGIFRKFSSVETYLIDILSYLQVLYLLPSSLIFCKNLLDWDFVLLAASIVSAPDVFTRVARSTAGKQTVSIWQLDENFNLEWSYIIKISKNKIFMIFAAQNECNSSWIISIITQEWRCIKFFNVYKSLIMITNAVQYFCWNFWPTSVNKCNAELRNVAVTICSAIEANFCHDHSSPKIATNFRQKLFKSTLFSLSWLAQMSVLLLETNFFLTIFCCSNRPT